MSHELRTPLNAIIGYVDLMDLGIGGTIAASHGEYLRRIRRGADTLLRLIDDVLTFAKLEGGRTEYRFSAVRVIDVADALEEFIAPRIALKGLAYQFVPCDPDLVVCVDRAKLEQILLNLLSNAVKFTNFGRVEVVCGSDKQHARIEVRDTGEGIRAELHEAIFEPFVQVGRSLTRTIEGTGLGLSISRQMARAMGGDITVESIVGQGSTFTVILPRDVQPCDS
jgi:signal transduction histidine kinase